VSEHTKPKTKPRSGEIGRIVQREHAVSGELIAIRTRATEIISSGIVIADARRAALPIVYCNVGFSKLTGYAAAEVVGRSCKFLQGDDTDPKVLNKLRRALKSASDVNVILKNYRKDGSVFWNELSITPVLDEDGLPTHFIGIQNDVTQRVRAQKGLVSNVKKLEHLNTKLANANIDLEQANQALHYRSMHDSLTGAANRALFDDHLKQAIERRKRHMAFCFAVLYIDLDSFKMINDGYGHGVGDDVLMATTEVLRDCVRPNDTVARLGGDEFAILLENLGQPKEAEQVAERIRHAMNSGLVINGLTLHVSASIGIVNDGGSVSSDELLSNADSAMYRAKKSGKNRNIAFDPSMRSHPSTLHNDLRVALDRGELEVYFQPILRTHDATPMGFEALARWQHPHLGAISPAEFIPVAESTGMILELDLQVLRKSCEQMVAWQAQSAVPLTLNVNCSGYHLLNDSFTTEVSTVLKDTGFPASQLVLELTESIMMNLTDDVRQTLEDLKALGVQLYIDDFGTGFSSLRYLQDIPSTALKIARPFVEGVHNDPKSQTLLRTVISLAHNLGMGVVAEGVELAEELDFVKGLGCEYVQGFLFRPAIPAAGVTDYLRGYN